ncbi:MAG: ABC transporter substrate-binding protein [candidate division NC10 bacterium]
MTRFRALMLAMLVAAGGLVAGRAAAQDAIKIGFFAPLTGFAAADGASAKHSAEIAVEEINAAGGIKGRKVELVVYDDRHDSKEAFAIGRALMARPRLLLVDEASLGLAPIFVERVYAAIRALVGEGLTLLLVEQNVQQTLATVGRAYVLEVGRIVREGSAAELARDPAVRDAYLGA